MADVGKPAATGTKFQGLENKGSVFPGLGKSQRESFQGLEKAAQFFPSLGKAAAFVR
jgi:hypothetical protein